MTTPEDAPTPSSGRVSISRDALRADLLQLRLDLNRDIEEALRRKADLSLVLEMRLALDKLSRGEFTEAQERGIDERVRLAAKDAKDDTWTSRERLTMVVQICSTVAALAVSLLLAAHGLGWIG